MVAPLLRYAIKYSPIAIEVARQLDRQLRPHVLAYRRAREVDGYVGRWTDESATHWLVFPRRNAEPVSAFPPLRIQELDLAHREIDRAALKHHSELPRGACGGHVARRSRPRRSAPRRRRPSSSAGTSPARHQRAPGRGHRPGRPPPREPSHAPSSCSSAASSRATATRSTSGSAQAPRTSRRPVAAVGLEVDARDQPVTEQERQHVVAVHAAVLRDVDLDAVVEVEQPLGALAAPHQRVERRHQRPGGEATGGARLRVEVDGLRAPAGDPDLLELAGGGELRERPPGRADPQSVVVGEVGGRPDAVRPGGAQQQPAACLVRRRVPRRPGRGAAARAR
jgi:hypothetical protein